MYGHIGDLFQQGIHDDSKGQRRTKSGLWDGLPTYSSVRSRMPTHRSPVPPACPQFHKTNPAITELRQGSSQPRLRRKTVQIKHRNRHSPFSRYLNSIVPDSGRLDPSRAMFGLNGAHDWNAAARSSSLTYGGRLETYSRGSWR